MKVADRKKVVGYSIKYSNSNTRKQHFKIFKAMKKKKYPVNRIFTLNYHGTKRAWIEEFELIYNYVCSHYSVYILVDCFGGSGFLSLLASKTNLFKGIHLNEMNYSVINYHYVMKYYCLFRQFIYYITRMNKQHFDFLTTEYKQKGSKRKQLRKPHVKEAVLYFIYKYYSFRGSGDYMKQIRTVKGVRGPKNPVLYVDDLKNTHDLYKCIKLSQYHYKKTMKHYLNDSTALIMLDPPYLDRDLIKKNAYACGFTFRQHRYLLQELTKQVYEAKICLSGFDDELYNHYFSLFNRRNNKVVWHNVRIKRLGKRKNNPRHEHIWVNFDISGLVTQYTNLFELIY